MKILTYKSILSLIFVGLFFSLNAQEISRDSANKIIFISPIGTTHYFTGTFGELRPNHIHSGVDLAIKKNSPVYAVEDGYVSRIKISSYGYGYALYVTHYNGYVSVYGHLNSYNDEIESFIRKIQNEKQSWSFDHYLDYNELKVKQGDIIAYSGNSGHSFGPHIHFEIRDEITENIINPLIFNLKASDNKRPLLEDSKICIYNLDNNSRKHYTLTKSGSNYTYNGIIGVNGDFGIQFLAYDQLNNRANHNGIYKIQAFINDSLYFQSTFDRYSFDESRYLNDIIDYQLYKEDNDLYYRTFISPNNTLQLIDSAINNGVLNIGDNNIHNIKIILSDYNTNSTYITFKVEKDNSIQLQNLIENQSDILLQYSKDNYFETEKFKLYMPGKALFNDLYLDYNSSKLSSYFYSDKISIHNTDIPLYSAYTLAIKVDIDDSLLCSKLLIVEFNDMGHYYDIGGVYRDSYVYVNTRTFGQFAVKCDTVAPKIKSLDKLEYFDLDNEKQFEFSITDNLSGVDNYNAFINNKWTIMYYDHKKNKYILPIDYSFFINGENTILIEAFDERNNYTNKSFTVDYN